MSLECAWREQGSMSQEPFAFLTSFPILHPERSSLRLCSTSKLDRLGRFGLVFFCQFQARLIPSPSAQPLRSKACQTIVQLPGLLFADFHQRERRRHPRIRECNRENESISGRRGGKEERGRRRKPRPSRKLEGGADKNRAQRRGREIAVTDPKNESEMTILVQIEIDEMFGIRKYRRLSMRKNALARFHLTI